MPKRHHELLAAALTMTGCAHRSPPIEPAAALVVPPSAEDQAAATEATSPRVPTGTCRWVEERGADGLGLVDDDGRVLVAMNPPVGARIELVMTAGEAAGELTVSSSGVDLRGRGGLMVGGGSVLKPSFGVRLTEPLLIGGWASPQPAFVVPAEVVEAGKLRLSVDHALARIVDERSADERSVDERSVEVACHDVRLLQGGFDAWDVLPQEPTGALKRHVTLDAPFALKVDPQSPAVVKLGHKGSVFTMIVGGNYDDPFASVKLDLGGLVVSGYVASSEVPASDGGITEYDMIGLLNAGPSVASATPPMVYRCPGRLPVIARREGVDIRLGETRPGDRLNVLRVDTLAELALPWLVAAQGVRVGVEPKGLASCTEGA